MSVLVRPARPGDAAAVAALPGHLLYHGPAYRDLLVDHLGCRSEELVAERDGTVVGFLPVMWHRGVANSLPFYGSHGGVLAADAEAAAALLDAWDERATDPATRAATLVGNPFAPPLPRAPAGALRDARINQATALPHRPAGSAARNVAKARRSGYAVARAAGALGELARLHAENMAVLGGRAKAPSFFAAVPRHFAPGTGFDVYVARHGEQLAAALLVFWTATAVEYFTPAVAHAHRPGQPLALVLAELLADAAARGCAWCNWGGTWPTQQGVHRFKRKWGARDAPYGYVTQVNDAGLLDATPAELVAEFGHFYVAPYAALKGAVA